MLYSALVVMMMTSQPAALDVPSFGHISDVEYETAFNAAKAELTSQCDARVSADNLENIMFISTLISYNKEESTLTSRYSVYCFAKDNNNFRNSTLITLTYT